MYKHIDLYACQSSKYPGKPCGDVYRMERNESATLLALCDGIGSGIRANLAATMCASRLLELIRRGMSLRESFQAVVKTMNEARGRDLPYAAFTVIQIRPDGEASALSYEIPPPLFLGTHAASLLDQHRVVHDNAVLFESHCLLDPGDALLAMTDGISQAGLGPGAPEGWSEEGVCHFVSDLLARGGRIDDIADEVHERARQAWRRVPGMPQNRLGDDCTVVVLVCSPGRVVNIMTGPPLNPRDDRDAVSTFLGAEGTKVVCGATTARLVARCIGEEIRVIQDCDSLIAPPRYEIKGIDLVTEGAVTLNQAFNLLDEDLDRLQEDSGVTRLCRLLHKADRINIHAGRAANMGNDDLAFKQQGLLHRQAILPLLEQRLREQGKLVVVDWR